MMTASLALSLTSCHSIRTHSVDSGWQGRIEPYRSMMALYPETKRNISERKSGVRLSAATQAASIPVGAHPGYPDGCNSSTLHTLFTGRSAA
jgi:hypothetical protein